MTMIKVYWDMVSTSEGELCIAATDHGLCYIGSYNSGVKELQCWLSATSRVTELCNDQNEIKVYKEQLEEYFAGSLRKFSFKVDLCGTDFQIRVWSNLLRIPYGKVCNYSDIASWVGNPGAVRAVGTAIGSNPLMIVIPCHRVLPKSGGIGGYRGGQSMKASLLSLEKRFS